MLEELEEGEAGPAHPVSGAGGRCVEVAGVMPTVPMSPRSLQPWGCGPGCPSLQLHQPLLSHEGQVQGMSHGSPCLSLQTSFQFSGELSKQSGTVDGKDSCVPLA